MTLRKATASAMSLAMLTLVFTATGASAASRPTKEAGELIQQARAHASIGPIEARDRGSLTIAGSTVSVGALDDVKFTVPKAPMAWHKKASTSSSFEVVVEGAENRASANIIVNNGDAPRRYTFHFELPSGSELIRATDGSVFVGKRFDGGVMELATIDPAWAVDAKGKSLPTRYEIVDGSTLVQLVDHTGAAYPVVADPNVKRDCGLTACTWYFSKRYTKDTIKPTLDSAGSSIVGALGGALICGKLPGAAAVACAAYAAIHYTLALANANTAAARNLCFTARANYLGALVPVTAFSTGYSGNTHCPAF